MKKKLTLFVAAVLTTVSLSVLPADAGWCSSGDEICGGDGMCCFAGFGMCFAWDCSK